MFELFIADQFLDPVARATALDDLRAVTGAAATVHGHGRTDVAPRVRHAIQLAVCEATRRPIEERLSALTPALAERFGVALSDHEPLQFLRYDTGGFFVAHQDGNTPLIRDRTLNRRISVVIFLNAQTREGLDGGYAGGELVFHGLHPNLRARQAVVGLPGSLIAFRSETTHEVAIVTGGERYTIATWFHGASGGE